MDELYIGGSAAGVVGVLTFVIRAHVGPLKIRLKNIEDKLGQLAGLPERVAVCEATLKERKEKTS